MTRRIQSNNSSGIAGLRLIYLRNRSGSKSLVVQASWCDGHKRSTSYSVERHGPIKATALALEARQRGSEQLVGFTAREAWYRMKARAAA
jgi:hypothetical protein